jgi:hypothetical protein
MNVELAIGEQVRLRRLRFRRIEGEKMKKQIYDLEKQKN